MGLRWNSCTFQHPRLQQHLKRHHVAIIIIIIIIVAIEPRSSLKHKNRQAQQQHHPLIPYLTPFRHPHLHTTASARQQRSTLRIWFTRIH
jgi:hypothetical protein